MNPQRPFNRVIRLINFTRKHLSLVLRFHIPETCMLIKVPSESVSRMVQSRISSADKTSSLDSVVPIVKSRRSEVLVNGMNFKTFKWVNWSHCMLPYVSDNIVEAICFEHIDWIWGKPVLQIDVTDFSVLPCVQVFGQEVS